MEGGDSSRTGKEEGRMELTECPVRRKEDKVRLKRERERMRLQCSEAEIAMSNTVHALINAGHLICVHQQQQLNVDVRTPSVPLHRLMDRDFVTRECLYCLVCLCNFFPKDRIIDGDTLVQLWMADYLIKEEPIEEIGASYLRALQSSGCVSLSSESQTTGKLWCHINQLILSQELSSRVNHLMLDANFFIGDPSVDTNDRHLTVTHLLKWSPRKRANIRLDDDILEYLQPHKGLRALRVFHYGGSVFPSWISDPSFNNLSSITLFRCENCSNLPSLGQLPRLESLEVTGFTQVVAIGLSFYRGVGSEIEDDWFPNLQKLTFSSMLNLEKWEDVKKCHFPELCKFTVKDCPKLTTLFKLSNIDILQHLEIVDCPLLPSLPEGCLPSSVEKLVIEDCPLLKSSCSKPYGQDWDKIKHVISVWVDYKNISIEGDIYEEDYIFDEEEQL